jgi:hypothetical protein
MASRWAALISRRLLPRLLGICVQNGLTGDIQEPHLARGLGGLAVAQNPEVGLDAGVVEELLGQADDGVEPVVLQNPAADFALAAAGLAGEQGRAVEHDADVARRVGVHVGQHVQEEEELAVGDARQSCAEATVIATLRLFLDFSAVNLPFRAVGRIGELEIEAARGVGVLRERGAEGDVVGVAPGGIEQEHFGAADGPRLRIQFLTEEGKLGGGIARLDLLAGDGQHAAGAGAAIGSGAANALGGDEQVIQQPARG